MMRPIGSAVLVVLLLGGFSPSWSQEEPGECQYVLVVDEAYKGVRILNVGEAEVAGGIGLDRGDAGDFAPIDVDFTTVPGDSETVAFVTQGPFLRVVELERAYPRFTLDVEGEFGLDGIGLTRLDAAGPVTLAGEIRYPLYVTGQRSGAPWILVFDQAALLESSTLSQSLLAAFPLPCDGCGGVGLDIAAGGAPAGGGVQEAFVSVLEDSGADKILRIHRIVMQDNLSFNVSLDPWNDEGVPYDGSAMRANGLDFDSTGTRPFGVFQTTSVVKDLSNGDSSCALDGHPNDVAVWGPDSGMEHPDFLFVTSVTESGADWILGFPAGGCPDGGADTLSLPVSGFPRALALSSVTGNTPWIYTANRHEGVTAVHLELSSDSETGDRIDVLESFVIPLGGGPVEVAIRDEAYHECVIVGNWVPPAISRPPKVDCEEDPDDPRCKKYDLTEDPPGGPD